MVSRLVWSALVLALLSPVARAADAAGELPTGADGKALNLDFETGTLKDWTVTGAAFENQPVKGDTVAARRNDMRSDHKGQYWIGTYEKGGDALKGTLVSAPFKVTHPWAMFLAQEGYVVLKPNSCAWTMRPASSSCRFPTGRSSSRSPATSRRT